MLEFRSLFLDSPLHRQRVFDIFSPADPKQDTALFFIHGGGWKGGSRTIYYPIIEACVARGYEVATTDYRVTVDVFAQVSDIREALARFGDDLERRGRPRRVVLSGGSAGAHLTLLTAMSPWTSPPPVEIAGVVVQAAPFTFEPWEDIFPASWQNMQAAVGASYEEAPELFRKASPLHLLSPSTPPVLHLYAENEHMYPLHLSEAFAAKAKEYGVSVKTKIYPRTEHGFLYNLDRWQQREALEDILAFVGEVTS